MGRKTFLDADTDADTDTDSRMKGDTALPLLAVTVQTLHISSSSKRWKSTAVKLLIHNIQSANIPHMYVKLDLEELRGHLAFEGHA